MVTNVTSLLKTVKTIEDEHQRGTRALEAAIEAIGQEISLYDSGEAPSRGNVFNIVAKYCTKFGDSRLNVFSFFFFFFVHYTQ